MTKRAPYMAIRRSNAFCPTCNSQCTLLLERALYSYGPKFYICRGAGCGFIGMVGIGIVARGRKKPVKKF